MNALAREYPNIIQQVIQERPTGVSSLGFGSNQGFRALASDWPRQKSPRIASDLDINRIKVDCLSSSNELLRNTTLLLLINVAENNPILQKIIVFENCFEILLNVALSEGGIDNSPGLY